MRELNVNETQAVGGGIPIILAAEAAFYLAKYSVARWGAKRVGAAVGGTVIGWLSE